MSDRETASEPASTVSDAQLVELGERLDRAWVDRAPIGPLTDQYPGLRLEQAYRIQQHMLRSRLERTGECVVGKKIGVTSQPVMDLLGVHQPDFGVLTSAMACNDGETIATDGLIAPKAEGEIAFLLKRDLYGPGIGIAEVLAATEVVLPCFEIVDSRIRDWKIRIQDTVADNASAGRFVLGNAAVDPRKLDLALVGMTLEKNGEVVATGAGAAALGHPANAVAWLANTMGRLGTPLRAGEVILSGSLATMVPVRAGDHLRVSLSGIGHAGVRFT